MVTHSSIQVVPFDMTARRDPSASTTEPATLLTLKFSNSPFHFFQRLMLGERPRRPIQSPNNGRKKGRLRGEGDSIHFIDLRFEGGQLVGLGKGIRQHVP